MAVVPALHRSPTPDERSRGSWSGIDRDDCLDAARTTGSGSNGPALSLSPRMAPDYALRKLEYSWRPNVRGVRRNYAARDPENSTQSSGWIHRG